MKTKKTNTAISQVAPNRRVLKPIKVLTIGEEPQVKRPVQSFTQALKRGLVDGVSRTTISPALYDDKEGAPPKGVGLDVDKFDFATELMKSGESTSDVNNNM